MVRTFWIALALFVVTGIFRANVRIDRAEAANSGNRTLGAPGPVITKAQHAVLVWAGAPGVAIDQWVEKDHWRVVVQVGAVCYQVAVSKDMASAHPGQIPCPSLAVAGVDKDVLDQADPRRGVVVGFLTAWLSGDPTADRYLSDDRPSYPLPPTKAQKVQVGALYGDAAQGPGTKSTVTATADVFYPDHRESMAWTFVMAHGDSRWAVSEMSGGEVPTGDSADLARGWVPDNKQGE